MFAAIGLKLLFGWGKLTALLKTIPWKVWAVIGVILALLLLWHVHGNWAKNARDVAYNQGFNVAWAAHQKDIAAWKVASKKAEADQSVVNARPAIVSGQIAGESDEKAKTYYDEGYRAAAAYAAAHRVPGPASSPGDQGRETDLPGAGPAVQGDDGPSPASELAAVTVSQPDFDLLVGNSLRLARVRQDVEALIDAGIAVPNDAPAADTTDK